MTRLMSEWHLSGGQLAVAKEGRLVFDRGYGYADAETAEAVGPNSLFRIASVSKTLTTVAILKLVDDGLLALDDRTFRLLALQPLANAPVDPRLDEITIEQLLVHAGGWDSVTGFDPQYQPWTWLFAGVLGVPHPPSAEEIVRAMLGVRLDFDPGTRSVYSNFGFNVLGRVVERVSGQSYEAYVRDQVLTPAGVTAMRLGRTRPEDRAPGEVRYYAPPGQALQTSVFPGVGYVPFAYGGFFLEALDSHGGWIGSAADLVRFATAVDGQRGPALLQPATVKLMLHTPRPPTSEGAAGAGNEAPATGLGWVVQPVSGSFDWSHAGALEGSNAAWLIRRHDGLAIAFTVNSLPEDFGGFFGAALPAIEETVATIGTWPDHDLFADGTPTP
jgi:N-acyl-D-amino-acid deacylase